MRSGTRLTRVLVTLGVAVLMAATAVQWGAAQGGIITTDLTGVLTPADLVAALVDPTNPPTISNVVFTGSEQGGGTFSGGAPTVGFDSGIVLGSGMVGSVAGPNDLPNTTTIFDTPGDPDLDALIPGFFTQDATILEFNFQCPVSQVVSFRYVFTSEEYNEFVNSEFNDVFGFFLNGTNIALLPGTTTPVAINNVNGGNPIGMNASNPAFFVNNTNSTVNIEPDGLTVVLGAEATINPGVNNHIKLAIADAGDPILDSWVFIQRGSFQCAPLTRTAGDFEGDRKTDLTVFRPSDGNWFIKKSSTNFTTFDVRQWGGGADVPMLGDYDGDGKADVTVYRPSDGNWFILKSSTNFTTFEIHQWGGGGDRPLPGDFDGDGRADLIVYRPSTGHWFIKKSTTNYTAFDVHQWGSGADVPVPGDYDGDGKADVTVYRPSDGNWFILTSSTNYTAFNVFQWGGGGDVPVRGDYDGDGKADLALYRASSGHWFIKKSTTNYTAFDVYQWGSGGDVPVPVGDYDGDGKTEVTIYRPSDGNWFMLKSSTAFATFDIHQWGAPGDIPALRGR